MRFNRIRHLAVQHQLANTLQLVSVKLFDKVLKKAAVGSSGLSL
jgi:hypothetical protein